MKIVTLKKTVLSFAIATAMVQAGVYADSRQTTYGYNTLGQVTSVDGPRTDVSDITTYDYDLSTANLLSVTNAAGHKTAYSNYTGGGLAQTITTPNGTVINVQYDWKGRILQQDVVSNSGTQTTVYTYDKSGQLISVQQPNGAKLSYEYDGAHRLIAMSNDLGERIDYTLDSAGNITEQAVKDASSTIVRQHQQVFDDLSRVHKQIGGTDQQTTQLGYDKVGNNTEVTDPKNNPSTENTFDALSRLTKVIDSAGGETKMTYNGQGLIKTVTDPRGLVTTYGYNGYGELTQIDSPDTGTTTFKHDDAGNVTSRTNANGTVVNYTYDALNRLTEQNYPADATKNILFSYDDTSTDSDGTQNYGLGQLTQITYYGGQIDYRYNQLGRLIEEQRSFGSQSYITQYQYNEAGQLTTLVYPSGRLVNYSYNAQGQLSGLTTQADSSAIAQTVVDDLDYLPFGPTKRFSYGNDLAQSFSYDLDYRLTAITSNVQDWVYKYDLNSNIEAITHTDDTTKNQSYGYDELNRLTSASGPYGDYTYTYDEVGNRTERKKTKDSSTTTETYTYASDANQLDKVVIAKDSVETDSRLFTYSASGQLLTDINNSRTHDLNYDENDRLSDVKIYGDDSSNAQTASYQYNPLGQRIIQTATDGTITHIHYNASGQRIAESDADGKVLREYIYLGQQAIAMVITEEKTKAQYFIHNDHLGTPKLLTNTSGTVVWQQHTTPFGEITETLATGIENLKSFPGQYRDSDTGYSYNYYRDYDASLGRYVQSDPIGLNGGLNTYAYVGGNPVMLFDPYGLRQINFDVSPSDFFWGSLKKQVDVESLVDGDPLRPFREQHYLRNLRNNSPSSVSEARQLGWTQLPPSMAIYHMMGCGNEKNTKWVSKDGLSEAVFDEFGKPDYADDIMATYNFSPPTDTLGHAIDDVIPYYIWGNTPNDPTRWWNRLFPRTYKGECSCNQ